MSLMYTQIIGSGEAIDNISFVTGGRYIVLPEYDDGDVGGITIDAASVFLKFAGYCAVKPGKITVTQPGCVMEIGPGWPLPDVEYQGVSGHVTVHNGATVGVVESTVTGDELTIDGKGFGAVLEGVKLAGNDCRCCGFSIDSLTPGNGDDGVLVSGGNGRAVLELLNVVDSDRHGFYLNDAECLVYSCVVQGISGADYGVYMNNPRCVALSNVVMGSGGDSFRGGAACDNCVVDGNFWSGTNVPNLISGASNTVYTRNRSPGSVLTDSGTGTTKLNNNEVA